jgi:hypothetical protein
LPRLATLSKEDKWKTGWRGLRWKRANAADGPACAECGLSCRTSWLAAGMIEAEILADYPERESKDIRASLLFAATRDAHDGVDGSIRIFRGVYLCLQGTYL